jgi:alkaline phosphatase
MIFQFLLSLALIVFSGSKKPEATKKSESPGKSPNIILLIGDGMGHSQLSTALYYTKEEPNYVKFPIVGLSRTSSSSHKITDSAAGATAFSCGIKTYNGAIGVGSDSLPLPTILEDLEKEGWQSALISTSSITHATPASFYGHVKLRSEEFTLAEQLIASEVDFFAGGGKRFFYQRLDEKDLRMQMQEKHLLIDTLGLVKKNWNKKDRYGFLLAKDGMPRILDGRGDFLTNATNLALDYLQEDTAPFFLMVEGSQIDWGGHDNNGDYVVSEMLDFDKAIGAALDFAEKDGNTLVIVTADHECGGFALKSTRTKVPFRGEVNDYDSLSFSFGTSGHTAAMVPVLAYGPSSELFSGIYQNNDIYTKILKAIKKGN